MDKPYAIGSEVWPGLSKLIEELGEVQQVLGKILGAGGSIRHWAENNLAECLEEEMGDLFAAISFVIDHNNLNRDRILAVHLDRYKLLSEDSVNKNVDIKPYSTRLSSLWCGLGQLVISCAIAHKTAGIVVSSVRENSAKTAFRMEMSLGYLQAALNFVMDHNPVLRQSSITLRLTRKKAVFETWHANPRALPGDEKPNV